MMNDNVTYFVIKNRNYFTPYDLEVVKVRIADMTPEQLNMVVGLEYKDPSLMVALSFLFGYWGVDRFYVGDILLGFLKLITFGGLCVWWIIDCFLIIERTNRYNYELFMEYANIR